MLDLFGRSQHAGGEAPGQRCFAQPAETGEEQRLRNAFAHDHPFQRRLNMQIAPEILKQIAQRLPDAGSDFAQRRPAVNHAETGRLRRGERKIALAHTFVKRHAFVVDARLRGPGPPCALGAFIAPPGARQTCFQIDIDQQRRIGLEPLAGDAVEFENSARYRGRARSPDRPGWNR